MSHHMNIFDGAIRHDQAIFMIKSLPIVPRALDCLFHSGHVVWMNQLENKLHGTFRGFVILENSKGYVCAEVLAGANPPAEASGMTEPLSFRQIRVASLLGTPTRDENAFRILQGNRPHQLVLVILRGHRRPPRTVSASFVP